MSKYKCKLGLHDWKYLNDITRQCMECGKLQYKKSGFWIWKWMNTDNYFQHQKEENLTNKE